MAAVPLNTPVHVPEANVALYVHRKSPLGVFAACRVFIEKSLIKASSMLAEEIRALDTLSNALSYTHLIKERGGRREPGFTAPEVSWYAVMAAMQKCDPKAETATDETAELLKRSAGRTKKDIHVVPSLHSGPFAEAYIDVTYRDLLSLSYVLGDAVCRALTGPKRDRGLASTELPGEYGSVSKALGIDAALVKDTPLNSDSFTLNRLVRAIRGEYVLNSSSPVMPWHVGLVNASSGLLENATIYAQKRGGLNVGRVLWKVEKGGSGELAQAVGYDILLEVEVMHMVLLHDAMKLEAKNTMDLTEDDVLVVKREHVTFTH
jgi:hypothetical protein